MSARSDRVGITYLLASTLMSFAGLLSESILLIAPLGILLVFILILWVLTGINFFKVMLGRFY